MNQLIESDIVEMREFMYTQTLITIHPVVQIQRYGFETTQLTRARLCHMLGYRYLHLAILPQLYPDWRKEVSKIGFAKDEIVCLPHHFSDIGHSELRILPTELKGFSSEDEVVLTEDGYVAMVKLANQKGIYYFTEGPFLFWNAETNELTWFHKDGSEALRGRFFNPYEEPTPVEMFQPGYLYRLAGKILTEEELLVQFLLHQTDTTCVTVRDQHQYPAPALMRFIEFYNRKHFDYIHQNVLLDIAVQNLRKKTHYLVASEVLTETLTQMGYQAHFLPPIVADNTLSTEKIYQKVRDFCMVGNMKAIKQIPIALAAFKYLHQIGLPVSLTLYGGEDEDIKRLIKNFPPAPNVHFKGKVEQVPYENHDCYISTSGSELFANACVEALSHGLLALLSNVDIAHRYYASQSNAIKTFNNAEELVQLIIDMSSEQFSLSNAENVQLASRYSLDKVKILYQDLFFDKK